MWACTSSDARWSIRVHGTAVKSDWRIAFTPPPNVARVVAKKDEISLDERTYECEVCGLVTDRDLNAALKSGATHYREVRGRLRLWRREVHGPPERGQVLFHEAGTERETIS